MSSQQVRKAAILGVMLKIDMLPRAGVQAAQYIILGTFAWGSTQNSIRFAIPFYA